MKRIAELDGLRGLAALIVVVSHYFGEPEKLRLLMFGWLGVSIFFVLSGFLIGSIILGGVDEPRFFRAFYLRRTARIVPVYYAVVALTLIAAYLTTGHVWSDAPHSPGVYATFTTNIAISLSDVHDPWLLPTWTLAVEEQFYLVLPLIIFLAPRRWLAPLLAVLWVGALGCRLALAGTNPSAAWALLPCRMDLLLSGVMLALIWQKFDFSRYLLWLRVIPIVALVALAGAGLVLDSAEQIVVSGSVASIGIASFLLSILCGAPEAQRYRGATLRWFGKISYGLYLVHQPISGLLAGLILDRAPHIDSLAGVAVTLLALIVSIGVAAASWYAFEAPIIRWTGARLAEREARTVRTVDAV